MKIAGATKLFLISANMSFASATPLPTSNATTESHEIRQDLGWKITLKPEGCGSSAKGQSQTDNIGPMCWTVGGPALLVEGTAPKVTTWSGNNCEGSSDSDWYRWSCRDIPFGSVSWDAWAGG